MPSPVGLALTIRLPGSGFFFSLSVPGAILSCPVPFFPKSSWDVGRCCRYCVSRLSAWYKWKLAGMEPSTCSALR